MTIRWVQLAFFCVATAVACGCKSTVVVVAPHAEPNHATVGVVEHRRFASTTVSDGIIAVSEAKRGDLVWRVVKTGRAIQLCSAGGCVDPVSPPGKVLPTSNIRFIEAKRTRRVSPRAGVWAVGGARLPNGGFTGWALRHLPLLYYCWMNGQQPTCEPAQIKGQYVPALAAYSTQVLRRGDELDDVAWLLSFGAAVVRCTRTKERSECQFASR